MPTKKDFVSKKVGQSVGVVVIGRNEGGRLLDCIESVKGSGSLVVYADSASSDGSLDTARNAGAIVVSLPPDGPLSAARGRAAGLNRLVEVAPNLQYVQFVDGDCIMNSHWMEEAVAFLETHPQAAAVCGRRYEARPDATFYNRLIDTEWDTPIGEVNACGGDSMMRRDALVEVGNFRSDLLAGEEPELCARLRKAGWSVWRLRAPMTEHDANISRFGEWWRRAERSGFGYAQAWSATREIGAPIYAREIASAVFWSAFLPLSIIVFALAARSWSALLVLPLLAIAQIVRMALRRPEPELSFRLRAAATTLVIKFAELIGILRYYRGGATYQSTTYHTSPDCPASDVAA